MLSLDSARSLKKAGLQWTPAEHDFFAVPFQGLDEQVFVISDMSIIVEAMSGQQTITFNGTAEWALDSLIVTDAIWVPTESQLRTLLEERLVSYGEAQPVLTLTTTSDGYQCAIQFRGEAHTFADFGAEETYAAALQFILEAS